jgi:hypothetical protein
MRIERRRESVFNVPEEVVRAISVFSVVAAC